MRRKLTTKEKKIVLAILLVVVAAFLIYSAIKYFQSKNEENPASGSTGLSLVELDPASSGGNETEALPGSETEPATEEPTEEPSGSESAGTEPETEPESTLPPQTDPPGFWEDLTATEPEIIVPWESLPEQTDPPGFWEDLTATETEPPVIITPTTPPTTAPTEPAQSGIYVTKNGTYTDREGVAQYLHTYGKLPSNFITKKQAKALGWDSGKNLASYAPGKSIGGDYFSNYEGVPGKGTFHECDINYKSGKRGAERIVWSGDGRIFYSPDHYTTYYEWKGPNQWVFAYRYDQ